MVWRGRRGCEMTERLVHLYRRSFDSILCSYRTEFIYSNHGKLLLCSNKIKFKRNNMALYIFNWK